MSKKLKPYRPSKLSGGGFTEVSRGIFGLLIARQQQAYQGYRIAMVALSVLFLVIGLNIRGWFISRTPAPVNNIAPVNPQPGPRILPDPTIVEPGMDGDGQMKYRIVVPTGQRQAAATTSFSTEIKAADRRIPPPVNRPARQSLEKSRTISSGSNGGAVSRSNRLAPRQFVESSAGEREPPTFSHGLGDRVAPRIHMTAPRTMISPSAESSDPVATRPRRLGKKGKEE